MGSKMRRSKGIPLFWIISVVLFISITLLSDSTIAALNRDELTKEIGDKWQFRNTQEDGTIMLFTLEVTGEDKIDIEGQQYDVLIARGDGEIEDMGEIDPDLELVEGSVVFEIIFYYSKDETAQKSIFDIGFDLKDITDETVYDYEMQSISTETLISGGHPDIINVGDTWSLTVKEIENETMTITGGIFQGNPYFDEITTTSTINYECLSKKSVTVTAGTFETYEIKKTAVGDLNYSLEYVSPKVKREVKSIDYDENDQIISIMELISYEVTKKGGENGTPGFELVIILGSLIFALILIRKNRS